MTKYQQRQLKRDLYRALPAFVTGLVMLGFVFLSMVIFTLNQG